jgi:hypothetical protein
MHHPARCFSLLALTTPVHAPGEPCTASDCDSHVGLAVLLIGGSILGGIAVGSIVATRPREKWQRVSVRPTLGLTGEGRSVGLEVRLRFQDR